MLSLKFSNYTKQQIFNRNWRLYGYLEHNSSISQKKNVTKWLNQNINNKLFNKIANKVSVGKKLSAIFKDCQAGFHNLD